MLIKSRYVILCVDKIALFLNKFSRNTRSGERKMGLPDYGEVSKARPGNLPARATLWPHFLAKRGMVPHPDGCVIDSGLSKVVLPLNAQLLFWRKSHSRDSQSPLDCTAVTRDGAE